MVVLKHLQTLKGHKDRIWTISWSPNGEYLASSGSDRMILIWRKMNSPLLDGSSHFECIFSLSDCHLKTIRCISWSPDGKYLCSASFDAVCNIYKFQNSKLILVQKLEGHENEVKCITWCPINTDVPLIATCSRDKSIWLWSQQTNSDDDNFQEFESLSILNGHTQDVKSVYWHPKKEILISCSYDDTIKMWNEDMDGSGEFICTQTLLYNKEEGIGHTGSVWQVALNDEGNLMASVSEDKSMILWKLIDSHNNNNENSTSPESLKWNFVTKEDKIHHRSIYSVDWLSKRGNHEQWKDSGKKEQVIDEMMMVDNSNEEDLIATGCGDNFLRVFQVIDGHFELKFEVQAHETDINCVKWSPSSKQRLLATVGDDKLIKIWLVSN